MMMPDSVAPIQHALEKDFVAIMAGQPGLSAEALSTFSVVIPAFNEEKGIAAIIERVLSIRSSLTEAGFLGPEVIVVDDGSRDRTREVVQRFAGVRLICHAQNRGYGAALKTGLAQAGGDLIGFLDADGTYPPEHFSRLCREALAGADVVIGSRMSGEDSQMPLTRRLGNWLFAGLVTFLGNHRVRDCASGMRVIRREVLPRLYPLPDGLNFTPLMSMRAIHEGLRLVEVPIPYSERVGASKLSVLKDGMRYLQSIVWTALSYNPVRVLGVLGLGGIGLAGLLGLGLIVTRLRGVTTLRPLEWAAIFAAMVAGVSGVSLFNLGATFNYLLALYRKQPVHMGLFGKPIFDPPLDRHFGWMGLMTGGAGGVLATVALTLGLNGWEIARLWLYLVGSALLILVGLQLVISFVLMRTLEELSERESLARQDMLGGLEQGGLRQR